MSDDLPDDPTAFTDDPVETGLVTATVNAGESEPGDSAEEVSMTPEAIQAAKALVNLPEISVVELAQLAREIAQDISQLGAILAKHKLTQAQYDFLDKHNKFFRATLESEIKNWQSIKTTEVRLRLQAQAALEEQMPKISQRIGSASEKLGDVVEGAKWLSRVAGVDTPPAGPATAGDRYQIVIDLGAGRDVVIAAKGGATAGDVATDTGALPGNSQAQGDPTTLRRDPAGSRNLLALPALPEGQT